MKKNQLKQMMVWLLVFCMLSVGFPGGLPSVSAAAAADVHLASLPIAASQLGYGSVTVNGKNAAGSDITLWDGTSAAGFNFSGGDTGIGMHAMTDNKPGDGGDAYVEYDISAYSNKVFRALAGVDAANGNTTAEFGFEVLVDNLSVYSSGMVTSRTPYLDIQVPIPEGAHTLRLAMSRPSGSSGNGGWGDWVNARLVAAPEMQLVTLTPTKTQVGYPADNSIKVNGKNAGGSDITLWDGASAASFNFSGDDTGIGMHAMTANKPGDGGDAYVEYDISAYPHKLFRALAGVDAANGNTTAAFSFKVLIDNVPVYSSDLVTSRTPYLDIYALIPEGAQTLRLAMSRPEGSNGNGGWGDWVNARLVDAAGPENLLMSIAAVADSPILEIGQTAGVTVTGTSLGKAVITAFTSLTYESSDAAVLSVDEQGTVTGIAKGSAVVTVRATLGSMTRTAEVPFTVTLPGAKPDLMLTSLAPVSQQNGYQGIHFNDGKNASNAQLYLWDGTGMISPSTAAGDTSIGMHAMSANTDTAFVEYDIAGKGYNLFRAWAGVDPSTGESNTATATFSVLIDGEAVYTSSMMGRRDAYADIYVLIPADAARLTIAVGNAGDGNNGDWTNWMNARLVEDPAAESYLGGIVVDAGGSVVNLGEEKTLGVQGRLLDGTLIGTSGLDSTAYESSNTDVLTVDGTGKMIGVAEGSATVKVTIRKGDIVQAAKVAIAVRLQETAAMEWVVKSPGESIEATLGLTETGRLVYRVASDGEAAIHDSALGLETSLGSLSSGLVFDSRQDQAIDETYPVISGKNSSILNHANEMTVRFTKDGVTLAVVMRAYDDGFAVRYGIEGTGALEIASEATTFTAPDNGEAFMLPYGGLGAWNEDAYISGTMQDTVGNTYNMPFLYKTAGSAWVLLNEAALSPEYTGSVLVGEAGNALRYTFSPTQKTSNPVVTTAPWVSPWRSAVIGSLGDIVENHLAENLSPAPDPDIDWSFVEPGIAAWLWYVAGSSGQNDPELYKQYIDYAASMGWKYMVMDEGWQGTTQNAGAGRHRTRDYPDWLKEVADYGKSKGIGLMAWMHSIDVDTPDEQDDLIWMISQGVVGFKLDFFNSTSQKTMKLYDDLYKFAAKHKVMLDIHGTNQTTGEIRTYPHLLTREGIRAQEFTGVYSSYNTIYPFTRTAVGPADFNPGLDILGVVGDASVSHRLALNVMYESGLPMPSDSIAGNAKFGADMLLKDMPVAWDETHLVDGYPGKYAILSRRSGDDWYVAGISTDARTAAFNLDFLGSGSYTALVYQDGQDENDKRDMDVGMQNVTAASTLSIPVRKGGGFTVRISKQAPTYASSILLNAEEISLDPYDSFELKATLSPADADFALVRWSSSDETVAVVDAAGVVTAKAPGEASITAATGPDYSVTAESRVTVRQPAYVPGDWTVRNGEGNERYRTIVDENTLALESRPGELGEKEGLPVVPNLFVRKLTGMASQNFSITVKVDASPTANYHTAGITIFNEDTSKSVSMMRRFHGGFGGNVFELHALNNGAHTERTTADELGQPAYLKLVKEDSVFKGYFSADGTDWTEISQTVTQSEVSGADEIYIGLYAINGSGNQVGIPMTFSDFQLDGQLLPFAVENTEYEPVTVTSVTVTPLTAAVQKGASQQFSAAVVGTNAPARTVTWTVGGNASAGTTITGGGLLTVGADESASTLTVTATSTADTTKSGTAAVTVKATSPGGGDGNGTGGDGNGTGGNGTGTSGGDTATGENSAVIEVNGEKQDVGTSNTQTVDGRTVTTVKVDGAKLADILASKGDNATVTLPVNGEEDAVIGELDGQAIKSMEQKNATLEIKTDHATYTLPASLINIDAVSAQLGSQVALKDITVSVRIAKPSADTVKMTRDTANRNNYQIIVDPIEFEITCTSGDSTVAVSKFNGYVERTIAIPDGVDPSQISTGVVLGADGTFRHVPTEIVEMNGKYYAVINSMTNSVYAAIGNQVEFSDMTSHWAKDAVNDMGARLVVSGVGNGSYEPERSITRAEFASILVRAMGLAPGTTESGFRDVSLGDWFNGYVDAASSYNLIAGYDASTFGPNDTITREQAMAILARAMQLAGLDAELGDSEISELISKYSDAAAVSDYARAGVAACIKAGIVSGKTATTIAPKDAVTRAEVAVLVRHLLEKAGLI